MKWIAITLVAVTVLAAGYALYMAQLANPRVTRELREDPQGELAKKVMILTLPSGKAVPVNYLRDGETVYSAADGPWWRELKESGGRGSVFIRGETLSGRVRIEVEDAALRDSVFERLRPTAPRMLGTLVIVELDREGP